MITTKLYREIAGTIQARLRCIENNNGEWFNKHSNRLLEMEDILPHGSGIDNGCKIDLEKSNGNKIVINTAFHHMDENGFYDGWTDHKIIITPSLTSDFDIKTTGKDRNMIKEYLSQVFYDALTQGDD